MSTNLVGVDRAVVSAQSDAATAPDRAPIGRSAALVGAGSPRAELRVTVTHPCRGLTLYTVAGDVDLSTGDEFRTFLSSAIGTTEPTVVVDLSGVDFFGLIGLQVLLDTQAQILYTHRFRLVTGVWSVDRVLHVTGLAESFETFGSIDAALADIRPCSAAWPGWHGRRFLPAAVSG